jgi:hypothetical protein
VWLIGLGSNAQTHEKEMVSTLNDRGRGQSPYVLLVEQMFRMYTHQVFGAKNHKTYIDYLFIRCVFNRECRFKFLHPTGHKTLMPQPEDGWDGWLKGQEMVVKTIRISERV